MKITPEMVHEAKAAWVHSSPSAASAAPNAYDEHMAEKLNEIIDRTREEATRPFEGAVPGPTPGIWFAQHKNVPLDPAPGYDSGSGTYTWEWSQAGKTWQRPRATPASGPLTWVLVRRHENTERIPWEVALRDRRIDKRWKVEDDIHTSRITGADVGQEPGDVYLKPTVYITAVDGSPLSEYLGVIYKPDADGTVEVLKDA